MGRAGGAEELLHGGGDEHGPVGEEAEVGELAEGRRGAKKRQIGPRPAVGAGVTWGAAEMALEHAWGAEASTECWPVAQRSLAG